MRTDPDVEEQFLRTAMLLGDGALSRLQKAHVAVFGLGGVGGYAVEALARAGVGQLTLVDNDTVSLSNLNRQLLALHSTLGLPKVDAAKRRVLDINPDARPPRTGSTSEALTTSLMPSTPYRVSYCW